MAYYSEERKGDIMSRMTNDLMEIEFSVIGTLEVLFKSPILMTIYLGALFMMSWELTLFSLIFLPISGYLISRVAKSLKNAAKRGKSKLGELMSVMEETLTGMRIIKAFNGETVFRKKFEEHNQSYFRLMLRLYKREYLSSPTSEFVGILVVTILLYFGGRLVLGNDSSLSGEFFIGYLVVFSQIIQPAKAFADAIFKINKGGASIERINEILDADETIMDKPNAKPILSFEKEIEFRNVRFSYTGDEVIKGISFKIRKGETFALVGPSGGGKSTLANLMSRYYDVKEGQILIDGVDIRDYKLTDVRHLMGIVTQDSILFNDTVKNNISLGLDEVKMPDIHNAARIANAEEFIVDLPDQYDFNVGDGGNKLSGGQKQRLSIARALFKNPPILILDEATSALDTRSEKLVQEAITNLMKSRTSLVIAHRLSTIQHANQILVIKDGIIAEQGSHQQLMELNGTYRSLVELQQFD
jgi:subfamily B ATP-binding cassette protein MsbA